MNFVFNSIQRRKLLSFSMVVLINVFFAYKYFLRGSDNSLLAIFYAAFLILLFIASKKMNIRFFETDVCYYTLLFLYLLFHIVLFHFIHVENLNVDRWSMISAFWEQSFQGSYSYNAQSHMGNYPGPLPFCFILALPFYLVGEIGFFPMIGVFLLAVFLRQNLSQRGSMGALVILLFSVSVFWEVCVRSTVLVNTVLFMLYLVWLLKDVDLNSKKQFWISAIVGGLLLSTRTIFIIPFIIYGVFLFQSKKMDLKLLIPWMFIVATSFVLTFLPFLLFHFHEFLIRNPFSVQSGQLFPFRISVIFVFLAVLAGFISSGKKEVLYYTVGLFMLVLLAYYMLLIDKFGFMNAYLHSYFDLSYMFFVFPFLLVLSYSDGVLKDKNILF
jgi:hypothetical protein